MNDKYHMYVVCYEFRKRGLLRRLFRRTCKRSYQYKARFSARNQHEAVETLLNDMKHYLRIGVVIRIIYVRTLETEKIINLGFSDYL